MWPTLRDGDIVAGKQCRRYRQGQVVVASVGGREVIKRIARVDANGVVLRGDNSAKSTDSRDYGVIDKSAIIGVMIRQFPRAVAPPRLCHDYGPLLGWAAAALLAGFATLHMFRIDTFVPELQKALQTDRALTAWAAAGIVIVEVFALPFLLRMKLSLLAQYVSGFFSVLAPLVWLLVSVWTYGLATSTAQLGEFMTLKSSAIMIALNALWVGFAWITLWALGYDNRPQSKALDTTRK